MHQVALFKLDRDQDISGGGDGEHQVGDGHGRSGPEHQQEAHIQRMAHVAVEPGGVELQRGVLDPTQIQIHLAQTEEVKMVEQKGRHDNDDHPKPEQAIEDALTEDAFHLPDHPAQRLPLPAQQDQAQVREEHVGAAFRRFRNKAGQPVFETPPGHHAVLHREHSQQEGVDQ